MLTGPVLGETELLRAWNVALETTAFPVPLVWLLLLGMPLYVILAGLLWLRAGGFGRVVAVIGAFSFVVNAVFRP